MADRKKASYGIHEYVRDNKSTFSESGFNRVDGLVLTQVSNLDLGNSGIDLYSGESKSFSQIWNDMNTPGTAAHESYLKMSADEKQLIQELGTSNRYKDLSVSNWVSNPSKNNVAGFSSVGQGQELEQFAAVTITYKQNGETYNYISYQPTNGTDAGWAEDFAMGFTTGTQAQEDSRVYMNLIGESTEGYITGGGHSKGGNDFEYAYLTCDEDVQSRIVAGYVYDSPGISEDLYNSTDRYDAYNEITDGNCIRPQDSIIGTVLHEADNATYVNSVESGINEHDPYSWEIDPNTFDFVVTEQSDLSRQLNEYLDLTMANMTEEQRKAFLGLVIYIIYSDDEDAGVEALMKLAEGWKDENGDFNKAKLMECLSLLLAYLSTLSEEERQAFYDAFGIIISDFIAMIKKAIKEKINEWIQEQMDKVRKIFDDIKNFFIDTYVKVKNWTMDRIDDFLHFVNELEKAIYKGLELLKNLISGSNKYTDGTYISIDTSLLRNYANRINDVNNRLFKLDFQMDGLYKEVGLKDLWNLLQADALTGYSWKLLKCKAYLNDTASDFDNVEKNLKKAL